MKTLESNYKSLMWIGPLLIIVGAVLSNEHEFKGTPLIIIGVVFLVFGFLYIKELLVSKISLMIITGLSAFFFLVPFFNSFELIEAGVYRFVFYWIGLAVTLTGNAFALRKMLKS
ncbi:MAG: hypothetical protein RL632_110 [Bacteroidota bacterium]